MKMILPPSTGGEQFAAQETPFLSDFMTWEFSANQKMLCSKNG